MTDIGRVPDDAGVKYVNRQAFEPFVNAIEEGWRVCSHGRWHTVRSVGHPIFEWDHNLSFGFEDGGGCSGQEVDAVSHGNGVIVTVYAPGKVPTDADRGDGR